MIRFLRFYGGKSIKGKRSQGRTTAGPKGCTGTERGRWEYEWHRFIDHLADGKDAESFFALL